MWVLEAPSWRVVCGYPIGLDEGKDYEGEGRWNGRRHDGLRMRNRGKLV